VAGHAFLALSCVGFLASAPAYAADAPKPAALDADPQQSDDILVHGQRVQEREPKRVVPLINTPRSIVVLPSEIIEQTGSSSLQDALRTVPGITFGAAEGGNPVGDRPFIRGFDSQGSLYLDGVRDLGAQSREVFAVDSVQIVRGSDSTLGGRGSAGGSINVVSKLPQLETFGRASASYGEADYKRVTADVNMKVADTVAFRIAGLWHDQDIAERDAVYSKRWGVAPSVTIGLGTPTRLTASYYYLESHDLPDSGIPYLNTLANAPGTGTINVRPAIGLVTLANGTTGTVDRSTFYGLASRDFRDATTNQAMLRAEHDFGRVTLRNTSRFSHTDQSYIYTQPDDSQGNVYATGNVWRRANTRDGYYESIVNQTDLYGVVHTGSVEHSFSVGAELSWEKARRGTLLVTADPRCTTEGIARYNCTSLFNPNPYDPWVNSVSATNTATTPIVPSAETTRIQNDGTSKGVYAYDSITLIPQLVLNLGARYDHFKSVAIAAGTTQVRVTREDDLFNWQAGLVFKPTANTSLYASYATAATPPNSLLGEGREDNAVPADTTTGINGALLDSLKPQKTKSYEVGAKANILGERLALSAAAFQTDISNARVTGDNNTVEFVGETRIRGIELSATGTILPGWTVFGGYSYLDPKIIDGGFTALTAAAVGTQTAQVVLVPSVNTGRQLQQTAKNSFTATTNLTLFKRLQLGGTAIYMDNVIGGYQDNRTATQTAAGVVTVNPATKLIIRDVPSYWRFDARGSFALTPNIELAVNAQNLTNKTYFNQVFTTHYAGIAPGRTIFGTVNLKF
jgi:catecholate siderophore receptor